MSLRKALLCIVTTLTLIVLGALPGAAVAAPECFISPELSMNSELFKSKRGSVKVTIDVYFCANSSKQDLNSDSCVDGTLRPLGGFIAQIYHMDSSKNSWDINGGLFKTNARGRAIVRLPKHARPYAIGVSKCCLGKTCPAVHPIDQITSFIASPNLPESVVHIVYDESTFGF